MTGRRRRSRIRRLLGHDFPRALAIVLVAVCAAVLWIEAYRALGVR